MKEIRTIKMVEVTDIKFVADDGTEFIGDNAEEKCKAYERLQNKNCIEKAFSKLYAQKLNVPFVKYINGDISVWKIILESKKEYYAMIDYFNFKKEFEPDIKTPTEYPCVKIIYEGYDWVGEYNGDLKQQLEIVLKQLSSESKEDEDLEDKDWLDF